MTNHELGQKLGTLIQRERETTREILELINLAFTKRAYVELGFSSMFDWLTRGFGYSKSAAYRRIEAAKALREVPAVAEKLEAGALNLNTLAHVQAAIRSEEKSGKITKERKSAILAKVENKSEGEVRAILFQELPASAAEPRHETKTPVNESTSRYSLNFSKEMEEDLNRAKEVLSHKFPNAKDSEILAFALKFLLDKVDPLRKPVQPQKRNPSSGPERRTATGANSKAGIRLALIQQVAAACQFRDPRTNQVCGSRYQVQIDHKIPRALGGSDHSSNLRILCRQHNLHEAEQAFGRATISAHRNPNGS